MARYIYAPGVVINEQGSSHFPRRVRRVRKLAESTRIRIGSLNIGSLTGKLRELVDVAIRRRINILCVQETKWKCQKTKGVEDTGFKLWYTGATSGRNSSWRFGCECDQCLCPSDRP